MSKKKVIRRHPKSNSRCLHLDPDSIRVWRAGKSSAGTPPIANLDDLRIDFSGGVLYFVADVSKRAATRRTEITIEFTPAALSQLAAIAVCADYDDDFPFPV